ncbi:MAG: polysaccharide deacetylase family protein [Firmicutes bacterium]|nr:polysaccharide deacetylase family protein [Bacillota bacterium]
MTLKQYLPAAVLVLLLLFSAGCGPAVLTGDDLEAMWQEEAAQSAQDEAAEEDKEAAAPAADAPSLRERGLTEKRLYLNGRETTGLALGSTLWCDCRELAESCPGFTYQENGEQLLLTDGDGHQARISCRRLAAGDSPDAGDTALLLPRRDGPECWVSLAELTRVLFFRSLWDEENDAWYLSPAVDASLIPAGRAVPVLMYHAVSDDTWGLEGLFLSPAEMADQLRFLTENGYDPIFFSDLTHLEDYDRPVLLTFDDGYQDNYSELLPLLRQYQVKATVFVITGNVDYNPNFLTGAQVRELADSGLVEIQSHTVNHRELASLTEEQQRAELWGSQLALARLTGRLPYVISYPAGKYNDATLALAPACYDFGVKSRGGLWLTGDCFAIDRFPIYRGADSSTLRALLE